MNPLIDGTGIDENDTRFDREMRQLHAAAVSQVSPQTRARLRAARHATPARGHAWRWIAATAFSTVLAVALGVQFLPQAGITPAATPAVATASDDLDDSGSLATLDESPDLYMWLASSEAEPLAME